MDETTRAELHGLLGESYIEYDSLSKAPKSSETPQQAYAKGLTKLLDPAKAVSGDIATAASRVSRKDTAVDVARLEKLYARIEDALKAVHANVDASRTALSALVKAQSEKPSGAK